MSLSARTIARQRVILRVVLCLGLSVGATHAENGRELFLAQCARCHGENGDGQGSEPLDRPARSFRDGGFSFGDTELAIFRTITHGIPGSPMPAFGEGLSEAQRRTLAAYVTTLGPPRDELTAEDTELIVGEHPALALGLLPPLVEGAHSHPRGLLLGTPDGLTFEYRADDLALLAVRQGGFARRSDWTGRGGTPLQPLGQLVWLNHGGDPPALLFASTAGVTTGATTGGAVGATTKAATGSAAADPADAPLGGPASGWQPLRRHPIVLATPDTGAEIICELLDEDGRVLGRLSERPRRLSSSAGSGFRRRLTLLPEPGADALALRLPRPTTSGADDGELTAEVERGLRQALPPGRVDGLARQDVAALTLITWGPGLSARDRPGEWLLTTPDAHGPIEFDIHVLLLAGPLDDVPATIAELLR